MHLLPPHLNNHEQTDSCLQYCLSTSVCGVQGMNESPRDIGLGESSRFREIVVGGLRAKQLLRGSRPRIEAHPNKRKNTTIAVEEVRQGLISFYAPCSVSGSPIHNYERGRRTHSDNCIRA